MVGPSPATQWKVLSADTEQASRTFSTRELPKSVVNPSESQFPKPDAPGRVNEQRFHSVRGWFSVLGLPFELMLRQSRRLSQGWRLNQPAVE